MIDECRQITKGSRFSLLPLLFPLSSFPRGDRLNILPSMVSIDRRLSWPLPPFFPPWPKTAAPGDSPLLPDLFPPPPEADQKVEKRKQEKGRPPPLAPFPSLSSWESLLRKKLKVPPFLFLPKRKTGHFMLAAPSPSFFSFSRFIDDMLRRAGPERFLPFQKREIRCSFFFLFPVDRREEGDMKLPHFRLLRGVVGV